MVTRVEVSFDQGKTWELCTLKHLPPNHAGKHFTSTKAQTLLVPKTQILCTLKRLPPNRAGN
jgi:hypothetical protein